ncbi:MAG: hypothetical protein MK082_12070 [Phycisphaerales bacterium]|nr:hypothetical protein [Phycisphaerales bacterium]
MGTLDLNPRERRFITASLRRGAARSRMVKAFSFSTICCWIVAGIAMTDSPHSMEARFAIALGGISLLCGILSLLSSRQSELRNALLAIDRCGECGHHLRGNDKPICKDISSKTCNECGTVWTDLDRRDSISLIYECA